MKFLSFEVLAIFAIGYMVGMSIVSGFILAEIRRYFVRDGAVWRDVAWAIFSGVNIIFGSINALTAFIMFVIGDKGFERPDFWPRAILYVAGIGLGVAFIAFSNSLWRRVVVGKK